MESIPHLTLLNKIIYLLMLVTFTLCQAPFYPSLMSSSLSSTCLIKPGIWTLVCWGENRHGNCDIPSNVKLAESVTMGFDYTCVISNTSSTVGINSTNLLSCWGSNLYNQIDIDAEFTRDVKAVAMSGY